MSRLDDLIHKLCPNGVEYQHFEDVCDVITDYTAAGSFKDIANNVKYIKSPSYAQLIRTTDLKNGFSDNTKFVYVDEHAYKYLWRVQLNEESIILPNVGNCGEVYYTTPSKFPYENNVLGPNSILVRSTSVNMRFLFYLFQSKQFQMQLSKITSTTGQTKFNKTNLRKTILPIPPLEVQQEIVRLLDDFTAKTAELQTELNKEYEARKKQYEYYKEVLLCNNENVDKVKIKDIVCKTNKIKWNQTENTYQYIDLSSVDRETHTLLNTSIIDRNNAPSRAQQIVCVDDVLFGTTRPMLKRLCVIPDEYDGQICSTGFCVLRAIDNIVQPKWIYHVLNTTQFYSYVESHQQGTSYPSISDSLVKEYEITLPSLDEQIRIINILDNLEETNFELNNNLSLELESRQKQYEFYRDKLLTFKELNESEVN